MNPELSKRRSLRHRAWQLGPWVTGLAVFALLSITDAGARPLQDENYQVAQTRQVLEKWVETRRIISQERKDWSLGKEILQERVRLVSREIESLEEKIAEAEKNISEADQKKLDFVKEADELKVAATALEEGVGVLEAAVLELLPRLPPPLQQTVTSFSQRIPEPGKESKLSLSQRYQNVIAVMNEVDKFNQQVSVHPDVRTLSDGSTATVTVIYVGLARGYYVSNNGINAGYGHSSEDGWVWRAEDALAKEIAKSIAIFKNEQPAAFVSLPVDIR